MRTVLFYSKECQYSLYFFYLSMHHLKRDDTNFFFKKNFPSATNISMELFLFYVFFICSKITLPQKEQHCGNSEELPRGGGGGRLLFYIFYPIKTQQTFGGGAYLTVALFSRSHIHHCCMFSLNASFLSQHLHSVLLNIKGYAGYLVLFTGKSFPPGLKIKDLT